MKLGKLFGIRVSMHWSFSLLIVWVVFTSLRQDLSLEHVLLQVVFVLTIFLCVILHEFGHSLVAMRYGGKVKSITLLPIGGLANITEMPEEPKHEFLVSAAGPLVNVIIASVLWLFLTIFQPVDLQDMEQEFITLQNFPVILLSANLFLVAFNLIPAFPMDGGRLFRSALAIKMSRIKATRIARDIGQIFAVVFMLAGLYLNPFLILIGLFVLLGANGEYNLIKYQYILGNYTVNDIVITDYLELDAEDTLEKAVEILANKPNRGFVVTTEGRYAGILTKNELIKGLSYYGKQAKAKQVMNENIEAVNSGMTLFKAYKKMSQNKYQMVPVFDGNTFRGVLDMQKINEFFMFKQTMQ